MQPSSRDRIVDAAMHLLEEGGEDAVSTRAVSAAAGLQAPTIYRLFGDKDGLLRAVVAEGYRTHNARKTGRTPADDPIEDLRRGWDSVIGFALERPALYRLMSRQMSQAELPEAGHAGIAVLTERVRRVAVAGRLRVTQERAVALLHAIGHGTASTLIATPPEQRDPGLSDAAWHAAAAAIFTDSAGADHASVVAAADDRPPVGAVALRAALPDVVGLSDAERALLAEWLDRISGAGATSAATPHDLRDGSDEGSRNPG